MERWKEEKVNFLTPNPMDQGILYKTADEVEKPLEVVGQGGRLPDWLEGTLIRDGPGLFEFGDHSADHAFDGMAMLRRYHIGPQEEGLAMNYSRRLVQSKVLSANREAQMFTKFGVGTPASDTTILKRLQALASQEEGGDNMVVQSIVVHGHYYATTELSFVIEYDPETLDTLGRRDIADMIPGIKLMTPHPMYDPDGTLWNIAMAMGPTKDGSSTSGWRYVVYKVSYLTNMKHMSRHLPTCLQD